MSQTLFANLEPVDPNVLDVAYELGLRFQVTAAGSIAGIRFYRAASDGAATYTGHIWNASGSELASVVFTGVSASGWQQQALAAPLAINALTTYTVSVNNASANPHLPITSGGLLAQVVSGDIASVADGNNGVFSTTPGVFPTTSFNNSNYFRDILFDATPTGEPEAHPFTQIISELGASGAPIGGSTATFSASNAPRAISPRRWITLSINGVAGYVPWFSDTDTPGNAQRWGALGASGVPVGISAATFSASNAPAAISPRRWISLAINGVEGFLPWFSTTDTPGNVAHWGELGASGALVGIATATFSASNAPRAISPRRWVTFAINGVEGFIPWFT